MDTRLHFAHPLWLLLGLAACGAILILFRLSARRRQEALQRFAAPHLLAGLTANVSGLRRRIKDLMIILAVACVFIALARPQYGSRWVEVRRKGIDILIAVDTSRSMLARDIRPDRLERAKLAIRDFVGRLRGDRVGLLPFAGSAFLMCPLTTDYEAFDSSLDSLDTTIIPRGGTDIAAAIRKALQVLSNGANHRILILVTDGENLEGDALAAAKEAKKAKMTIYTVGVGTPAGELIPLPDGEQGFVRDSSGRFVTSRLDEKTLTRIAAATGGLYVPLGPLGQGFDTIYRRKLALVPRKEHGEQMRRLRKERFAWPVAAALLLLAAEFLLPARKPAWRLRFPRIRTAGRRLRKRGGPALPAALLALLMLHPAAARASAGEEAYRAGRYDQAAAFYDRQLEKKKDDPVLLFNRGDAAYRAKKYDQALTFFNRALATRDLDLQARVYYNRGNTLYRLGEAAMKTDPRQTMELWQEALDSYAGSLKLKADDADARHNRALVEKRLKELRARQQQKNQKNSNKDNKKNNSRKKSGSGRSGKDRNKAQDRNNNGNSSGSGQQEGGQRPNSGPAEEKKPGREGGNRQAQAKGAAGKQQPSPRSPGQEASGAKKAAGAGQPRQAGAAARESGGRRPHAAGLTGEDRKRRAEGKMTRQEAIDLLDALKGDEGTLNFVPGAGSGRDDNEPGRNW